MGVVDLAILFKDVRKALLLGEGDRDKVPLGIIFNRAIMGTYKVRKLLGFEILELIS